MPSTDRRAAPPPTSRPFWETTPREQFSPEQVREYDAMQWIPDQTQEIALVVRQRHPDLAAQVSTTAITILDQYAKRRAAAVAQGRPLAGVQPVDVEWIDEAAALVRQGRPGGPEPVRRRHYAETVAILAADRSDLGAAFAGFLAMRAEMLVAYREQDRYLSARTELGLGGASYSPPLRVPTWNDFLEWLTGQLTGTAASTVQEQGE